MTCEICEGDLDLNTRVFDSEKMEREVYVCSRCFKALVRIGFATDGRGFEGGGTPPQ